MAILIGILSAILVIVCPLLVLVVLMQRPRSEGLGAAFGAGMTENIFGTQTTNVLTKATVYLAGTFFAATLLLTILTAHANANRNKGILEQEIGAQKTPISANPVASPSATIGPAAGVTAAPLVTATVSPIATASISPYANGKATPIPSATITPIASASVAPLASASASPEATTVTSPSPEAASTATPAQSANVTPSAGVTPASQPSASAVLSPAPSAADPKGQ